MPITDPRARRTRGAATVRGVTITVAVTAAAATAGLAGYFAVHGASSAAASTPSSDGTVQSRRTDDRADGTQPQPQLGSQRPQWGRSNSGSAGSGPSRNDQSSQAPGPGSTGGSQTRTGGS